MFWWSCSMRGRPICKRLSAATYRSWPEGCRKRYSRRASGLDIKNFWAISNVMPFQIYGHPSFKSLKESKGKKFAISRFGSLSEFLTRSSVRKFGVDPKDITMLQIGATPARFTTLVSGIVDATVLWFPVTERAKSAGFNLLFDLKELYPDWSNVGFIARESWLTKEKEQTIKFLRAFQRGVRHTRENRDDGIAALRKYVKMETYVFMFLFFIAHRFRPLWRSVKN